MPLEDRKYEVFSDQYFSINVEIRSLSRNQQRRHNNVETTQQVEVLANLWEQGRQAHQQKTFRLVGHVIMGHSLITLGVF